MALITVARRCAGDWIRNSSFENSSSLPGSFASESISATVITLPSTMPSLKVNSAFSFTQVLSALASATGSPDVYATELTPLRPLSAASTLVPSADFAASLFFTTW